MTCPRIAIAVGDPAGIGPEIALRAAAHARIGEACEPVLVGDRSVLEQYAGLLDLEMVDGIVDAAILTGVVPGTSDADCGRAAIGYADLALSLASDGRVDAVVACPHTQTSVAAAGIAFDGYPSHVARRTGTDPDGVFLMLVSDRFRIAHVTLHLGIRAALELIDSGRILRALVAMDGALRRMGLAAPRIAVSGINPHAGESGLFGSEEQDLVVPAIAAARDAGIDATGPFGADTMFLDRRHDAFLVMFHDQGHIPAKLLGRDDTAAFTIGTPVLFSSVAHGSALDIAGRGQANPSALIRTLERIAGNQPAGPAGT